jgi:hypothetical protein
MPKAASRYKKEIQIAQSTSGIGPVKANQPMEKQETETIPKPRYQAIFLGAASTHSGRWGLTNRAPKNIEGEYLAFPKSLMNISIMNKAPKARSGW